VLLRLVIHALGRLRSKEHVYTYTGSFGFIFIVSSLFC
jgi:hypothetical protein